MIQLRTRRHVCFVSVIEGDTASPFRERCEAEFFGRLSAERITVSMVAVNDAGCALAVDEYDLDAVRKASQALNLALRVRRRCARVAVAPNGMQAMPAVGFVIGAMAEAGIGVVHLAEDTGSLSVLVDERDAVHAQTVLARCAVPSSRHAA